MPTTWILVKNLSIYPKSPSKIFDSEHFSFFFQFFEINVISVDFLSEYLNLNLTLYLWNMVEILPFFTLHFVLPLVGVFSVNANSFLHQQKKNWIRKAIWYVVNQTKPQWISKPSINLRHSMMCRKEQWAQIRWFGVYFRPCRWLTAWPWESHSASAGFWFYFGKIKCNAR